MDARYNPVRKVCDMGTKFREGFVPRTVPNPAITEMDRFITPDTIVADMREWIIECIDCSGCPTDDREYLFNVARNASPGTLLRTVSDTHDRGILGFCETWYGSKWSDAAYEIAMTMDR